MSTVKESAKAILTKGELKEKRETLEKNKETLLNGQKYIIAMTLENIKLEAELSALTVIDEDLVKKLKEDAESIKNHPIVTDAYFEEEYFCVKTTQFDAYTQEGDDVQIMPLTVKLSLLSADVKIKCIDIDDGTNGLWTDHDPHPHVDGSNGHPCLGEASCAITELVTKQNYYAAMLMTLEFVQNVNEEDDAGKLWPRWNGDEYYDECEDDDYDEDEEF